MDYHEREHTFKFIYEYFNTVEILLWILLWIIQFLWFYIIIYSIYGFTLYIWDYIHSSISDCKKWYCKAYKNILYHEYFHKKIHDTFNIGSTEYIKITTHFKKGEKEPSIYGCYRHNKNINYTNYAKYMLLELINFIYEIISHDIDSNILLITHFKNFIEKCILNTLLLFSSKRNN